MTAIERNSAGPSDAVVSVYIDHEKKFALVEMRIVEEASNAMALGGILLCVTGSEAMFSDLGHFSYTAIQITFAFLVYPALILAYMGQAPYLLIHRDTSYPIIFLCFSSRNCEVAYAYNSDFCLCCGKSSHHQQNVLYNQLVSVIWMLPKSQGCSCL